jgi:hypothetical protein
MQNPSSMVHCFIFNIQVNIMQNIFMVNINLCVRFVGQRGPCNGKVGTWNGITTKHEGCVMTIKLLHNLVSTHRTWWPPLWSLPTMDLHPPPLSSLLLWRVKASSEEKLKHFITQCNLQETFVVKILKPSCIGWWVCCLELKISWTSSWGFN